MDKLVLIDGNSIMNRAFYGIMGSKMLTTKDGKYTNAVYGFLAILFNIIDDIKPEYIAVAFDLKGKLKRKELFEGYKANRHGMPDELAEQMPVIKDVLRAMNIDIIEKEGYEGDDIIGTISKKASSQGMEVAVYTNDKDMMQLIDSNVKQYKKPQKTNDYEVITVESFKEKYNDNLFIKKEDNKGDLIEKLFTMSKCELLQLSITER